MAVKVVMKRVPRSGAWRDVNMILRDLRKLAMSQPGYISGETLLSATDQGTTLVISMWETVMHWKDHENSQQRKALLDQLELLLAQPAITEIWVQSPVIG